MDGALSALGATNNHMAGLRVLNMLASSTLL